MVLTFRQIQMTISEKYVLIDLGNTVSIYKENKCWCMGGDKEEGVEVIGQQSRETLNLFFFPTDQQLFTQHHKRYHIHMQANTQTNNQTNNKQTNKQINKHYTMQQRHKTLFNTSVSNTILQNILYLMYLKSYFCCDPNSMRILCGWKIYGDNCDLFLSSRDFKCKERNWEFTKVHEGRCHPHFRLSKQFGWSLEQKHLLAIWLNEIYSIFRHGLKILMMNKPLRWVHFCSIIFLQYQQSLWFIFYYQL